MVMEMPGVSKENIKVNIYDSSIEVSTTEGSQRKYHEIIKMPEEVDVETAKSKYNNGILEVIFNKKTTNKIQRKTDKDRLDRVSYFIFAIFAIGVLVFKIARF